MDLDDALYDDTNPHDLGASRAALWRVRVRLADHPGALASVTARLAGNGCNVLGLSVLPIGSTGLSEPRSVIDEIVLAAPGDLTPDELARIVSDADIECVGVVSASVAELVDAPTGALRDAAGVLSGAVSVAEAVGRLLAAESIECAPRPVRNGEPIVVGDGGRRARVFVDGSMVTVTRSWAPLTELELARVGALVDLIASAPLPAYGPPAERSRRQLSSLDVQFLNAETSTVSTHVGSLTLLDPSGRPGGPVTLGELRRLIGSRLHLVAPLRWKLHTVPLGLDRPYWLDSGAVDVTRHVREISLPEPGTDEQLAELVGQLAARPLDRSQPLWKVYLVNGLHDGRQALYMKVHHAVIDGVSGAEILAIVLDLDRTPRRVPRAPSVVVPEPAPNSSEMAVRFTRNTARSVTRFGRALPALLAHLTDLPGAGSVPLSGLLASVTRSTHPLPSPRTPLNARVSSSRAFAFASLSLDEIKTVRKALDLTVNDVVMALCTTALRRWLDDRDALPSGPIVAGIPVSVRTPEEMGTGGNKITFMLAPLPTDVADPAERARLLRASLAEAKRRVAAAPRGLLEDVTLLVPQLANGLLPRAALQAARLARPPMNVLVSNVPGPQLTLYAAGARVVSNHPVSVISDVSGGVNITAMSYDGHLDVGVIACRRTMADPWALTRHMQEALEEMLALATRPAEVLSAAR